MSTRPSRAESFNVEELIAEHTRLKAQTAALRKEHDHLHTRGGTKAEHKQHLEKLRMKIRELEEHAEKLKNFRPH